jgi:hypothetical protein
MLHNPAYNYMEGGSLTFRWDAKSLVLYIRQTWNQEKQANQTSESVMIVSRAPRMQVQQNHTKVAAKTRVTTPWYRPVSCMPDGFTAGKQNDQDPWCFGVDLSKLALTLEVCQHCGRQVALWAHVNGHNFFGGIQLGIATGQVESQCGLADTTLVGPYSINCGVCTLIISGCHGVLYMLSCVCCTVTLARYLRTRKRLVRVTGCFWI